MQNVSGAAQYWSWDEVENNNLYAQFDSASKFLTASGIANQGGTAAVSVPVETEARAALRFAPGGGFGSAAQSDFVVGASGIPAGIAQYPSFLQGETHRDMTPQPLTLQVNYPKAGTFTVEIGQAAKSGANSWSVWMAKRRRKTIPPRRKITPRKATRGRSRWTCLPERIRSPCRTPARTGS